MSRYEELVDHASEALSFINSNGPAITSIILFLSLIVAFVQIFRMRRNQQEATARSILTEYLKICISNPVFAYPKTFEHLFDYETLTLNGDKEKFEQYEWFVSIMTLTMREIIDVLKRKDKYWYELAKLQISYHMIYIDFIHKTRPESNFVRLSGRSVCKVVDRLRKEREVVTQKTVKDKCSEPIQEEGVQDQGLGFVKRLSMMRIMARLTKAATVES